MKYRLERTDKGVTLHLDDRWVFIGDDHLIRDQLVRMVEDANLGAQIKERIATLKSRIKFPAYYDPRELALLEALEGKTSMEKSWRDQEPLL